MKFFDFVKFDENSTLKGCEILKLPTRENEKDYKIVRFFSSFIKILSSGQYFLKICHFYPCNKINVFL